MKKKKNNDLGFWEEDVFIETISPEETEEKMKTFHKKHDEDMNFNCKKCNKRISAHNKDWHAKITVYYNAGMYDDCFDKSYFKK